jgi:5-aminopentanamidase
MEALELIRDRLKWCETKGVDILCCPEAVLGGLADDAECPVDFAVEVDSGQLEALLAPLASKSVTAIVGFTETVGTGKLYNAAAVFHDGRVIGIYRKRHPAIRRSVYSAGDQSPLFTVAPLSFGIMICNDSNYPEIAADMVARGAGVIFVPCNNSLPPARADVVALTRAVDITRASDNKVMIVRADVAGRTENRLSIGSSAIIDARGTVLRAGQALREDILVAEVATKTMHRLATIDDANRLFELRRQSITELAAKGMPIAEAAWAEKLTVEGMQRKICELEIWIAEISEKVIGGVQFEATGWRDSTRTLNLPAEVSGLNCLPCSKA